MPGRRSLLFLVLLSALLMSLPAAADEVLLDRDGVVVTQDGPYRILKLRGPEGEVEQSRCDVRNPAHLYHEYTRLQLLGLLYVPRPRRILVVGLGGASLPRALAAVLPEARIDSVEIDPVVAEAARRFFFYREGPKIRTILQDARKYVETTEERYDLVFLDAFDGDEIPYPLRTVEFYRAVRAVLTPEGAVVANLIDRSPLHDRDRRTLAEVFPRTTAFRGLGNVVVVAPLGSATPSADQARTLAGSFRGAYPLARYFEHRETGTAWPDGTLPLLDETP